MSTQTSELPVELVEVIDSSLTAAPGLTPSQDLDSDSSATHVTLDSAKSARAFLQEYASTFSSRPPIITLTLQQGSSATWSNPTPRKGSKNSGKSNKRRPASDPQWHDDSITEDQLPTLILALHSCLERLHLRQLTINPLRRRNFIPLTDALSASPRLTTLTISGRPASDGQCHFQHLVSILLSLPNLKSLSIRHIRASSRPPTFHHRPSPLSSLAIYDCPSWTASHYGWLLTPSMLVDSLRTLALDYPHTRADRLRPIAWLGWPVRTISLSTTHQGVIEGFAHNLPSLERFEIDPRGVKVDVVRMLSNLKKPLRELTDRSEEKGEGIDLGVLAIVVDVGWPRTSLKKVAVRKKPGWARLEEVCVCKGIELVELGGERGEGPWIPLEFAAIRPVELGDEEPLAKRRRGEGDSVDTLS